MFKPRLCGKTTELKLKNNYSNYIRCPKLWYCYSIVYYPGSEGLIEDVILLGAPVSGDAKAWMPFSKIVAGKIVNGYSRYLHYLVWSTDKSHCRAEL